MAAEKSWFERLWSKERRRGKRQSFPPLVAYYWDGAAPRPHPVRDTSSSGMYLLTEQRWYPNTLVTMSLVRTDKRTTDPDRSIELVGKVVRSGSDGVGLEFLLSHASRSDQEQDGAGLGVREADRKTLQGFLASVRSDSARADHP